MAIAGFAIPKSDAADHAAQSRGRRRCPEYRGDVWSLVGMQNFNSDRLLRWTLPTVARVFTIVAILHRVGRVVLWIGIHAPALDLRRVYCFVFHGGSSLRSGRRRNQHRLDALIELRRKNPVGIRHIL